MAYANTDAQIDSMLARIDKEMRKDEILDTMAPPKNEIVRLDADTQPLEMLNKAYSDMGLYIEKLSKLVSNLRQDKQTLEKRILKLETRCASQIEKIIEKGIEADDNHTDMIESQQSRMRLSTKLLEAENLIDELRKQLGKQDDKIQEMMRQQEQKEIDERHKGYTNYITWKLAQYIIDNIDWLDDDAFEEKKKYIENLCDTDGVYEMIDNYIDCSPEFKDDLEEWGRRSINCLEIANEIERQYEEWKERMEEERQEAESDSESEKESDDNKDE